jgi:CheY-like chemotaxis protein
MNVLIVERPSAFRDALTAALRARGAHVHASDGALEALGRLREIDPGLVVVSGDSGPPDVASTVRLVRRQLGEVPIYHLHDASVEPTAPDARGLSRLDDVTVLAQALVSTGSTVSATTEAPPLPVPPPAAAPPPPAGHASNTSPPPVTAPPSHDAEAELLSEVEPLLQKGRWLEVCDLVSKREPDAQRLSPRLQLLFAVALKEAPTVAGPRPTVDPDLLGVRAIAALLGVDGQGTTALMIAKRVLRRRPLEWQREPPRRVSIALTLVALALGAAAGLAFSQNLIRWLFG